MCRAPFCVSPKESSLLRLTGMVVVLAIGLGTSEVFAQATHTYEGVVFGMVVDEDPPDGPSGSHTTGMRVAGSITFVEPLAPSSTFDDLKSSISSFQFSDGRGILSDSNSGVVTATATTPLCQRW